MHRAVERARRALPRLRLAVASLCCRPGRPSQSSQRTTNTASGAANTDVPAAESSDQEATTGDVTGTTNTSRHSSSTRVVARDTPVCEQVLPAAVEEAQALRLSDVETYINGILNAQEAEQLLKKVRDYPQVKSMMSTPVLECEICKSIHLHKEVPIYVSDLFQMMILRLAERNSEGRRYRSWNDVPNRIQAPILKVGKFAFEKLLLDQRLVFTKKELQNELILSDALDMGLLVESEKQYRFSHLTLQKTFASLYVFFTGTMTSRKIVQLVESIGPDAGHVRTFWTLLAARLNTECFETLVNSLMTRKKCGEVGPNCDVVSEEKEAKFLLNLHAMLCERLPASEHEPLPSPLSGLPVHSLPLPDEAGHPKWRSFPTRRMLAFQCFAEYAQHHSDRVQSVRSISASLEHKHGDVIVSGDDNPLQCRPIETVVRHHKSSVKKVRLIGCRPSSVCEVLPSLHEATNVSSLRVDCSPVSLVRGALKSFSSSLTNLSISNIDVRDEDEEGLSSAIKLCQKLENLVMLSISISLESLCRIAGASAKFSMLKSCEFSVLKVVDNPEDLKGLLSNLVKCISLEKLVLYACDLPSACLPEIADQLRSWPRLTLLNIGGNYFSDLTEDQAKKFIKAVKLNTHGGIRLRVSNHRLQHASNTHHIEVEMVQ